MSTPPVGTGPLSETEPVLLPSADVRVTSKRPRRFAPPSGRGVFIGTVFRHRSPRSGLPPSGLSSPWNPVGTPAVFPWPEHPVAHACRSPHAHRPGIRQRSPIAGIDPMDRSTGEQSPRLETRGRETAESAEMQSYMSSRDPRNGDRLSGRTESQKRNQPTPAAPKVRGARRERENCSMNVVNVIGMPAEQVTGDRLRPARPHVRGGDRTVAPQARGRKARHSSRSGGCGARPMRPPAPPRDCSTPVPRQLAGALPDRAPEPLRPRVHRTPRRPHMLRRAARCTIQYLSISLHPKVVEWS